MDDFNNQQPQQDYPVPQPIFQQPQQDYQQPQQDYQQPQQGYQQPQQDYQQPQQGYQQPQQNYQQPQQNYQQPQQNYQPPMGGMPNPPGKGAATGSLVCGIISLSVSVVLGWTTWACLVGLILGIVGAVLGVNAKKQGYVDGNQKAGLVLSIIGTVLNGLVFAVCLACTICIVSGGILEGLAGYY